VWTLLAALLVACGRQEAVPVAEKTEPVNGQALGLRDLDGAEVDPFAADPPLVFVFLRTDCPISNSYAPELRRLRDAFSGRGVGFWMVFSGTDEADAKIRRQLADHGLEGPALRDGRLVLARIAQVRVTPEVAVFDAGRRLVYHGRIDDRFAAFGVERKEPTRRELLEVLEALAAGKPVITASVRGVGCALPLKP
jgi:hypothetical protein